MRAVPLNQWLSAKQVAGYFGLQQWSAYRWREEGTVPEPFVKRSGRWRILFHPDVIPLLEKVFEQAHE
jgi:predicted site-specific integrase-resolvase